MHCHHSDLVSSREVQGANFSLSSWTLRAGPRASQCKRTAWPCVRHLQHKTHMEAASSTENANVLVDVTLLQMHKICSLTAIPSLTANILKQVVLHDPLQKTPSQSRSSVASSASGCFEPVYASSFRPLCNRVEREHGSLPVLAGNGPLHTPGRNFLTAPICHSLQP